MNPTVNPGPNLDHAREVADAVLYEGYLLYPYRASSSKNQSRWQFGVLGPPGAAQAGVGEDSALSTECVVQGPDALVSVHLRFLQLQQRRVQRADDGEFTDVAELVVDATRLLSWDEAFEQEVTLGPWQLDELAAGRVEPVDVPGGDDVERVLDDSGMDAGRLVRSRRPLHASMRLQAEVVDVDAGLVRLSVRVENATSLELAGTADDKAGDKEGAIAASFIGAHLLLVLDGAEFVSMTDPPAVAAQAVNGCEQHRCWPVLAGLEGDRSLLLVSPIILYDHPELAPQSAGALFDSTEIDEILTLRVMTMTDEEKAEARATDPRAAEIIDRCDALTPEAMQQMHGILRDPHALEDALAAAESELGAPLMAAPGADAGVDLAGSLGSSVGRDGDVPWWDPAVDASVSPESDAVVINGVDVSAGSIVRVHPSRRADAQDLFFEGQVARVTAVHSDVDGQTHVAVVLVDDPAADLHDWYGRYLYFAPDELVPMSGPAPASASPFPRHPSDPFPRHPSDPFPRHPSPREESRS